jgi:hypothetical protein
MARNANSIATQFKPGVSGNPAGTPDALVFRKIKRALSGVRRLSDILNMPDSFLGTPREFIECAMRSAAVEDSIRLSAARALDSLPVNEKKFALNGYVDSVAMDAEEPPINGHANGHSASLAPLSAPAGSRPPPRPHPPQRPPRSPGAMVGRYSPHRRYPRPGAGLTPLDSNGACFTRFTGAFITPAWR